MDAIISIVKSWRFWFIDKQLKMNKKGGFFSMLLGTLGASLPRHLLTGKLIKTKIPGQEIIRPGEETFRSGHEFFNVA